MKKVLMMLLIFVQLGTNTFINPNHVTQVYRHWAHGGKHHPGCYDGLTVIRFVDGHTELTTWSVEHVLQALKDADDKHR